MPFNRAMEFSPPHNCCHGYLPVRTTPAPDLGLKSIPSEANRGRQEQLIVDTEMRETQFVFAVGNSNE